MKRAFIISTCLLMQAGLILVYADQLMAPAEPEELHPAVMAFFESEDPFVQEVVLPNIETNRKSDIVLQLVTEDDQPLADCKVSVNLKRHEFLFGHCDLATESDPKIQAMLNEIFYYTAPGWQTKWKSYAPKPGEYDFKRVDQILEFCEANDITLEWHFLTGYHPEWLDDIESDEEKARIQMEAGRIALERYGDQVRFFQVYNEHTLTTHLERAHFLADQTKYFSELKKEFPDVELGVCDCWHYTEDRQLPDAATFEERYPGVDFISMHAHRPRQIWASPEEMYATYAPYADSDIKIHITEFGLVKGEITDVNEETTGGYRTGEWTDDNLAEYFVQTLVTAFSHKAVRAFNFWSNYKKFTGNPLFTEAGEPNAKYLALKSLLQDKLTTQLSGKTDREGKCDFQGFHGLYELTMQTLDGKTYTTQLNVSADSYTYEVIVNRVNGQVEVKAL